MKIVGVITEYNPFHYGHQYQLQEIRRRSQCDVLVVLMSGNIVQRGQFAIIDKWQRAKIALEEGADIVFELPLLASLQSADYFAKYSIQMLALLGCQSFYFGTEIANAVELMYIANLSQKNKSQMDMLVKEELSKGSSYAYAYQFALEKVIGERAHLMQLPNHQLGLQYLKANMALDHPMLFDTIQRKQEENEKIFSATHIREILSKNQLLENSVPATTFSALNTEQLVDMEDYWPLLKYQLITHTSESLAQILGVREGLEYAMIAKYREANSWHELVTLLVSKRWTKASINRILLAVLGEITIEQWQMYQQLFAKEPTLRLLGYRDDATSYLKKLRKKEITIITNWKKQFAEIYQLQLRMDRIYEQNLSKKIAEQNIIKYPICVPKKSQ